MLRNRLESTLNIRPSNIESCILFFVWVEKSNSSFFAIERKLWFHSPEFIFRNVNVHKINERELLVNEAQGKWKTITVWIKNHKPKQSILMHIDFEWEPLVRWFLSIYDRIISLSGWKCLCASSRFNFFFTFWMRKIWERGRRKKNHTREAKGFFYSPINSYLRLFTHFSRRFVSHITTITTFTIFAFVWKMISGKMSFAEDVSLCVEWVWCCIVWCRLH